MINISKNIVIKTGLALILFSLVLFKLQGNDIWMHLRTGQLIFEERSFPSLDPFTFTTFDKHWVAHEWLSALIFYVTFFIAGINGLIALKIIILSLVVYCLVSFLDIEQNDLVLFACWIILAAIIVRGRLILRPHLFSYLAHVLTLVILYKHRERPDNRLFWLIAIEILWANLHGATAFLGILISAIFGVSWYLENRFLRNKGPSLDLKRYLIVLLLVVLATLINPYGYKIYEISFGSYSTGIFRQTIREWSPLTKPGLKILFFSYVAALCGLIFFSLYNQRRGLVELLFVIVYGKLAISSIRFVSLFVFVTMPGAIFLMRQIPIKQNMVIRTLKTVLILFLVSIAVVKIKKQQLFLFGTGLDKRKIPVETSEFLLNNKLPTNIFNSFNLGGYLIWRTYPRYRVFVDGRQMGEISLYQEYRSIYRGGKDWREVLNKYDIDLAVIAYSHKENSLKNTASRLSAVFPEAEWALVFFDNVSLVFLKRQASYNEFIRRNEFKIVKPFFTDYRFLDQAANDKNYEARLVKEFERSLESTPTALRINFLYGLYSLKKGDIRKAIPHFKAALRNDPDHKPSFSNLVLAYISSGEVDQAIDIMEKQFNKNPKSASNWNNLARILANINEHNRAIPYYIKAIKLNKKLFDARYYLAISYQATDQTMRAIEAWREYLKLAQSEPGETEKVKLANKYLTDLTSQNP